MFYRREEPNQHTVLARLSTLYTLIDLQAQHTQDPNQRFYLDTLANILSKTKNTVPRVFSETIDYEKKRLSQWFSIQYDLINFRDDRLSLDLKSNETFSVAVVDRFYKQHAKRYQHHVQSPHAIISCNNSFYHYNCTVKPHTLTLIPEDQSNPIFARIKKNLKGYIYPAKPEEREWMANCIGISADIQARPINLDLVVGFLKQFRGVTLTARDHCQRAKKNLAFNSLLAAAGVFVALALQDVLYLGLKYHLTGMVVSTATMIGLAKIALVCAGLILVGGLGLALYSYIQERFFNHIIHELTTISYKSRDLDSRAKPLQIKQNLFSFFHTHQDVLNTAFTAENFQRANIYV